METSETDKLREVFGEILRAKRLEQKLSQEELAGRAGIAMRYVSLLECNKRQPTISTLYVLSKALGISMTDFVSEIERQL